jgi:peptidoglycan/LPS O-acetylase OafA/YrhL
MTQLARDGAARPVRLVQLSATRLIGALLVLVSHAGLTFLLLFPGGARTPYRLLGLALAPVVSYFFCLTGFVITWSYAGRLDVRTFYRGRIGRLVPTNLLYLLVGSLVVLWYGADLHHLAVVLGALMLQGWVFDGNVVLGPNPAAWSLSVDVFFYALFPLLLPLVLALNRRARFALVGVLVLLQVALAVTSDLSHQTGYLFQVAYFPASRLPEFLLGMIAALELRGGRLPQVSLRWATAGGAASLLAARLLIGHHPAYEWSAVAAVPSVVLIVALAQADLAGRTTFLARPALVQAGHWTFALFMLQVPVMRIMFKLSGKTHDVALEYLLALSSAVICVLLAWAQYTWFEQPLDRRIRGTGARSRVHQ